MQILIRSNRKWDTCYYPFDTLKQKIKTATQILEENIEIYDLNNPENFEIKELSPPLPPQDLNDINQLDEYKKQLEEFQDNKKRNQNSITMKNYTDDIDSFLADPETYIKKHTKLNEDKTINITNAHRLIFGLLETMSDYCLDHFETAYLEE